MKILILTQPLLHNYGCLLQNYALQSVLLKLGHDVKTIDYLPPHTSFHVLLLSWMKTIIYFCIGKKTRKFAKYKKSSERKPLFNSFVQENLRLTKKVRNYSKTVISDYGANCVVVGSDQVWRPRYNHLWKDMFLRFVPSSKIKRISYAASFGVDEWEFSDNQTSVCSSLVKKFNAISVREKSGVRLCEKYLGVGATWVLDPTLLLTKGDYFELCSNVPHDKSNVLAVYMLDMDESIKIFCENEAQKRGLMVKYFTAGTNAMLTVPEWLAMFRDASYVVTDSFHGTVFSIIFEKEFKSFYNEGRGSARFESLLSLYNSGKIDEMRQFSLDWLKNALDS